MPLTVTPAERVFSALDALLDERPELEAAVDFYEEILPLQYEARPSLDGLVLNPDRAAARLQAGQPLLWGESLADLALASSELFLGLCRVAAAHGQADGETLARTLIERRLDLPDLLESALTCEHTALARVATSLGVDEALLGTLARLTLEPILSTYARALETAVEWESWKRSDCPVCGGAPLLAELRGKERVRYLRCGRCGAGWPYQRLACAFCGTTDYRALSFLYLEEDLQRRVDVCSACRSYLKTLSTFEATPPELLLVEELRTLPLDLMAEERGYHRGTEPARSR